MLLIIKELPVTRIGAESAIGEIFPDG